MVMPSCGFDVMMCSCQWVGCSEEADTTANTAKRSCLGDLRVAGRGWQHQLWCSEEDHCWQTKPWHWWRSSGSLQATNQKMFSGEKWKHWWTRSRSRDIAGLFFAWATRKHPWRSVEVPLDELSSWESCLTIEIVTQGNVRRDYCKGQRSDFDLPESGHDPCCKPCQGKWQTLRVMTEQLAALKVTNRGSPRSKQCFKCGKLGHIASNCRSRNELICYNCGKRGHSYQNCWSQENSRGCPKPSSCGQSLELNNAQPIAYILTLAHNNHTAYAHGQLNSN